MMIRGLIRCLAKTRSIAKRVPDPISRTTNCWSLSARKSMLRRRESGWSAALTMPRIGGERRCDALYLIGDATHHDQIDFVPGEKLQDRLAVVHAQPDLDFWKLLTE